MKEKGGEKERKKRGRTYIRDFKKRRKMGGKIEGRKRKRGKEEVRKKT